MGFHSIDDTSKCTRISTTSGTSNVVNVVRNNATGKTYAIRHSKNSVATIPIQKCKMIMSGRERKTQIQSQQNWNNAFRNDICPHIYYNGYFTNDIGNELMITKEVYSCLITEAYDSDLASLYKKKFRLGRYDLDKKAKLNDLDITIRHNLQKQLFKMVTNNMWTTCFDIKPLNVVYNKLNHKVRLIDWDGDWCIPMNPAHKSMNSRMPYSLYILSCIIMANHFYIGSHNIFATYMQKISYHDILQILKDVRKITCLNNTNASDLFKYSMTHYFYSTSRKISCSDMLKNLYYKSLNISPYIRGIPIPDTHLVCDENKFKNPETQRCVNLNTFKQQLLNNMSKQDIDDELSEQPLSPSSGDVSNKQRKPCIPGKKRFQIGRAHV
jgi:hypothetical protein